MTVDLCKWQFRDPMLVLMSKQQGAINRSCDGCANARTVQTPFGDTMLICDKNRHGEWEGRISLWRHADSLQFTSDQRRQPIDMIGALA